MTFYLAGLPSVFLYLIIFLSLSIVSMISLIVIPKLFKREMDHLSGPRFIVPFFTINGAVLGFILAMILVETWKNYQGEKENITSEMSNIIGLYRLSNGLEPNDSAEIKSQVKKLVKGIIGISWAQMETGEDSPEVTRLINQLYYKVFHAQTKDKLQEDIRKKLLDHMEKGSELRRHRLLKAHQSVVPDSMWPVIFFCIFISISCGSFFAIRPFKLHIILNLFQCAMISFVLFLIIVLMYPYRGPMKIKPEPFEKLLNRTFIVIDQN